MKPVLFALAFGVVILAAGCRNGPTIEGCFAPQGPDLLYPRPGSTGIADGHLALWFGSNGDPSPFYSRPVISPLGGGRSVRGGAYAPPSPGPLPPGAATPQPNQQVFVSAIATYAPGTTYNVVITSMCGSGNAGTFSTQ